MKKKVIKIIRLFSNIIKKDNRLITILYNGYSGSNLTPIIEKLKDEKYNKYNVKVIINGKASLEYAAGKITKLELYKKEFEKYKVVFKSNLVISTHGCYRLRNNSIMINLWHGIPIKSMSLMNKSKRDEINFIEDDYFLSTSELFNTVMNSCIGITGDKYLIAGYPRNDYLFNENGIENLNNLVNKQYKGKIILFIPTYKEKGVENNSKHNLFGFMDFNIEKFHDFLEENDITFLLKLHPNEEDLVIQRYINFINDRMVLIRNKDLEEKMMDFYKVINSVDLLITDYSSVYFDYLLLDRPIIFTPVDLQDYRDARGLLLEPYEFWTPGYKCLNQKELQEKIILGLNNPSYHKDEREIIRNIFHKYQDENSTNRVMDLIESIMRGNDI